MLHYVSLRSEFRYDFCIKRSSVHFYFQYEDSCLFYIICVCLHIVVSITVLCFSFSFSSSCVPYVARFSGLSFRYYLTIIYRKKKQWGHSRMNNPEIQVTLGTLRGEVCVHKTSLTASFFIEELVPSRKSERPYISVLVVSILLLSTIF